MLHSSYHGSLDVGAVDRRAVGAVSKFLAHADADRGTIVRARKAGLGIVLPGEAWRNQLPLGHQKRGPAFESLEYALATPLDIEARLGDGFIRAYAAAHLDAQIARGATILLTLAHVLPREGGRGRANDLALARAAVDEYDDRRARHSAADGGVRPLFVTIIVRGEHVAAEAAAIAREYAGLDGVDGYWIVAANYNESLRQAKGLAALCDALERRTRRAVVLSGVSSYHLAFLARAVVSATCTGHHGATLRFPPPDWPRRTEGDEERGIGVHVQHRAILGAVQLGERYDEARRILFEQWPCRCGHHEPRQPPRTRAEILAHNGWTLMADAASLCTRDLSAREAYLEMRLSRATAIRGELALGRLRAGWRGPAEFAPIDEDSSEAGERSG